MIAGEMSIVFEAEWFGASITLNCSLILLIQDPHAALAYKSGLISS